MTTCAHKYLDLEDGAPCTSEEHPHNPGGHIYHGTTAPDKHTRSEDEAEAGWS